MAQRGRSLPPARRTALWEPMNEAAARGRLVLQKCRQCGTVQYPPRELCRRCLADALSWRVTGGRGRLLSFTRLHATLEPFFQPRLPWPVGLVSLDSGPVLFVHLAVSRPVRGMRVRVVNLLDPSGTAVLAAFPWQGGKARRASLAPLLRVRSLPRRTESKRRKT